MIQLFLHGLGLLEYLQSAILAGILTNAHLMTFLVPLVHRFFVTVNRHLVINVSFLKPACMGFRIELGINLGSILKNPLIINRVMVFCKRGGEKLDMNTRTKALGLLSVILVATVA